MSKKKAATPPNSESRPRKLSTEHQAAIERHIAYCGTGYRLRARNTALGILEVCNRCQATIWTHKHSAGKIKDEIQPKGH